MWRWCRKNLPFSWRIRGLAVWWGGEELNMSQFWKPGTERPQGRVVDDEEGGVLFLSGSHHSSSSRHGYASMEKQRQRLPVFKYRTAILYLVETHATTIIVGETGSGKTTQIPQVIYLQILILIPIHIHVTHNLHCISVPERSRLGRRWQTHCLYST